MDENGAQRNPKLQTLFCALSQAWVFVWDFLTAWFAELPCSGDLVCTPDKCIAGRNIEEAASWRSFVSSCTCRAFSATAL